MADNNHFFREVNFQKRESIVKYLKNHFRYDTMRSWNRSTSYANCVKIHYLNLPTDVEDLAWDLVCGNFECPDWDFFVEDSFFQFLKETGYSCGFNGRSSGYIVLYETGTDASGKTVVYPGRGIDMDADFDDEEEWSLNDLQKRAELVQAFDKMCDNLRSELIYILRHSNVEEYQEVRIHRRLVVSE